METLRTCFILLLHFIASVTTQVLEKGHFALVCPKGLLVEGISWYVNRRENVSVCANCKPEKEGHYRWIEICFAKNESPLMGPFAFKTQSCEDKSFNDTHPFLQENCRHNKSVCGITVKTGTSTLNQALSIVQSIPCTNSVTNPNFDVSIMPNTAYYDVDLVCPENSTLFALERFYLQGSGGRIPVLSALCKLNDSDMNDSLILIYAKGKLNDTRIMDLLHRPPDCPFNSVNGIGTRCRLLESPSKFCSLRWHSTASEKPILELLKCSNMIIMKPTALESTSPSQASQKPTKYVSAEESNPYIYIIIGTFVVLLIILIIFLTLHTVKVKSPRREDTPQKNGIRDNAIPNEENKIVKDEQLEDLCYEEVEDEQIAHGSKILQNRNNKISIQDAETIALQSNDKYLYTVPDMEDDSLYQTSENTNSM